MFTGNANELREREQKARRIAEQIADLLNDLESIAPGSVRAHGGRITGLAVTIQQSGGTWGIR